MVDSFFWVLPAFLWVRMNLQALTWPYGTRIFTTKTPRAPRNSMQEGHELVFFCVTLRRRAFAVKGFYRMPSLPGGSCLTSGPTRKPDESFFEG